MVTLPRPYVHKKWRFAVEAHALIVWARAILDRLRNNLSFCGRARARIRKYRAANRRRFQKRSFLFAKPYSLGQ